MARQPRRSAPKPDWLGATAVYFEPRVLAMLAFGFASGLPFQLIGGTLFIWLRLEGVDLSTIGLFAALGTPYALKFLWAPLLDRLPAPILGHLGRRRGWIVLTQIGLIAAIAGLGLTRPEVSAWPTAIIGFALALLSASQDIVIDAYRIESLAPRQQAAGAAMLVGGWRIGFFLVGGAGALYLADQVSWSGVYLVMAAAMLIGVVAALTNPEPPRPEGDEALLAERQTEKFRRDLPELGPKLARATAWIYVAVVAPFADFMKRPGWALILLFVMFFKFGDALVTIMTSPFLIDIGFSKIEIANILKLYGFVALILGLAVGGLLMNALGMIRTLWVTGILQLLSNLVFAVQAGVGHDMTMLAVTVGFENFASGMGTSVFVAYLSSLCHVAFTATQYALLSSFMAAARTWLTTTSGFTAEYFGWAVYFLYTAVAALPGLVLLWLVARRMAVDRGEPG